MPFNTSFSENELLHVFNRANGNERLFKNEDNYIFFLQKIKKYILPVADIYAYCLLPNHYHLVLQLKSTGEVEAQFAVGRKHINVAKFEYATFVAQCFGNCQNSYAKAFNKYFHRMGSLFMSPVSRLPIEDDHQLAATIFYAHKNPVHHGLCTQMSQWRFSSYNTFFSEFPTHINRQLVLDFCGGPEGFSLYHSQDIYLKSAVLIE